MAQKDHFEAAKQLASSDWLARRRVSTRAWTILPGGETRIIAGVGPTTRAWALGARAAAGAGEGVDVLLIVQDDVPDLGPHVLAFQERADGTRRGEVARIVDGALGAWEHRDV